MGKPQSYSYPVESELAGAITNTRNSSIYSQLDPTSKTSAICATTISPLIAVVSPSYLFPVS